MAGKLVLGKRNILLLLLILLPVIEAAAADTALVSWIDENHIRYSYDPFRKIGSMFKGRRTVSFTVDLPYFVVDYVYGIQIKPLYLNSEGSILIPEETRSILASLFEENGGIEDSFSITTIMIDPGHGGKDPGTIGTHYTGSTRLQLKEKDLVLDVSKILFTKLRNKYPDKDILLTRDRDVYLELEERTEIANAVELGKREAMIFVSVHANASLNSSASGFEVWYLPPDYRRDLLDTENLSDNEKEIAPILNTMMEEEFTVESVILARSILASMETCIGDRSENRGMKEESWFVVRNAKMPSVLIEIGFVTNKAEAVLLSDDEYLIELCDGIYNGLVDYIDKFDGTGGFTQ